MPAGNCNRLTSWQALVLTGHGLMGPHNCCTCDMCLSVVACAGLGQPVAMASSGNADAATSLLLPEHAHFQSFDDDWLLKQHDAELVVDGVVHPVYRNILCMWSKVLTECVSATLTTPSNVSSASLQPPRITLNDNIKTVQAMLKLVYSSTAKQQLDLLWVSGKQLFQDVVRLADKYDMPLLLSQMDWYLETTVTSPSQHPLSILVQAFGWLGFACSMGLKTTAASCETFIANNVCSYSFPSVQLADNPPPDSICRILNQMLQKVPESGYGSIPLQQAHTASLKLLTLALTHDPATIRKVSTASAAFVCSFRP